MVGEITILVCFSILFVLSLYLFFRGVEYRESIDRLMEEIQGLREANQNLSQIVQEDIEKLERFEADCG